MRRILLCLLVAGLAACGQRSDDSDAPSATEAAALEALSLARSGMGRVAYGASNTDGGRRVFEDVVMRFPGREDAVRELRAKRLEIAGARVEDGATRFDALFLEDVSLGGEGGVTIASVVLAEPAPATVTTLERAFSGVAEGVAPSPLEHGFNLLLLEGVAVAREGGDMTVDRMQLEGFADGRFETVVLEGAAASGGEDGGAFAFLIGDVIVRSLDLGLVRALSEVEDPAEEELAFLLAESGLNDPYAKVYDEMSGRDLYLSLGGLGVALDRVSARMEDGDEGRVTAANEFGALTFTADPDGGDLGAQAAFALNLLGFADGVELHGSSRQIADRAADRIVVERNELAMRDGFTLEMSMDIGGLGAYAGRVAQLRGEAEFDPERVSQAAEPVMLHGLELRLTDHSLVDRLLQLVSAFTGQTLDETRTLVGEFLTEGMDAAPEGPLRALAQE
ncbi:MAG: hypothetical protein MI723_15310, partial [Caulobacterales bacterium]|nr:hypothetical protein [Caulobacterales bacterium]